MGRHRAEDRLRQVVPAAGHLALAAPGHVDHAAGRRRGVRGVRAAGLAGPGLLRSAQDAPVRQVVGDLLLALGMAGQVTFHLLAQAGMARAPWAITTIVSCLPVLVLAMGTTLAHMLRADADAVDALDSGTGPPAVLRSPEDQAGPCLRGPEAGRGRSVRQDQNALTPRPQRDHGTAGPGLWPAQPQVDQARVIAQRLAAAGKPVSRRALRSGGVTGSNEALNTLARILSTELTGCRQQVNHPASGGFVC